MGSGIPVGAKHNSLTGCSIIASYGETGPEIGTLQIIGGKLLSAKSGIEGSQCLLDIVQSLLFGFLIARLSGTKGHLLGNVLHGQLAIKRGGDRGSISPCR
jgi:hypothetical protein